MPAFMFLSGLFARLSFHFDRQRTWAVSKGRKILSMESQAKAGDEKS